MDLGLSNKVAFVAGASTGLGFAVAQSLMAEGCHVAICSRNPENLEIATKQLANSTATCLPLVCDVTNETQIQRAFETVLEKFGKLNILITNAGGPPSGFMDDFSSDDWRKAIELNLLSTINLCRYALPLLRKGQAQDQLARIIMITSISAKQPIPNLYLSNTARAGVQGFAKSLSEELGVEGITVNTVLPGFTKTERLAELQEATQQQTGKSFDEIEKSWAMSNALKRIGTPEEFAATVTFLASKPAGYITGIGLPIDGGRAKGLL